MHMAHSNHQGGGGAGQGYFGLCPLRQGYSQSLASPYLSWREPKPVLHHHSCIFPAACWCKGLQSQHNLLPWDFPSTKTLSGNKLCAQSPVRTRLLQHRNNHGWIEAAWKAWGLSGLTAAEGAPACLCCPMIGAGMQTLGSRGVLPGLTHTSFLSISPTFASLPNGTEKTTSRNIKLYGVRFLLSKITTPVFLDSGEWRPKSTLHKGRHKKIEKHLKQ